MKSAAMTGEAPGVLDVSESIYFDGTHFKLFKCCSQMSGIKFLAYDNILA